MESQNESDNLVFRIHYNLLDKNPNYPLKQLWNLTKEHLEFLNSIEKLDEMTKIKIKVVIFELLEKIVTPKVDDYVNGSIDVPIEEIYGDESHIIKKIYGSDFEKQKLLDAEKIKDLIYRILYLPTLLLSNLRIKDLELVKKTTQGYCKITDLIRWIYKNHKEEIEKEFAIIKKAKENSRDKMFPNLWKKAEIFENYIYNNYKRTLDDFEKDTLREYMKPSRFKKLVGN